MMFLNTTLLNANISFVCYFIITEINLLAHEKAGEDIVSLERYFAIAYIFLIFQYLIC